MPERLRPWQQALYQLIFCLVAVFVLLPIWELAYLAFDGGVRGWPTTFRLLPLQPTLQVFVTTWNRTGQTITFLQALGNSLTVSIGAAMLSVLFGASMAYAFARFRFPLRQAGLFGLLLGTLLPPVALMTPLFILMRALHLQATLLALTIVYTSFAMPFAIWNMRAAFQSVPNELEEAAFLDGASPLTAFLRVTLPLAIPAIGVAAIVAFLIAYSEFAMGWLFVTSSDQVTLAMAIAGILNGNAISWSWMAALAVLMTLPVVVLFEVLQKSMLERMMFGSLGE
ncbi:MAG TPA: carbohydrate ABC transporter permease [Anaerolineales bacterium]|nr:carbohydrate ABC transporter permease [Anaerolineales bacterium]